MFRLKRICFNLRRFNVEQKILAFVTFIQLIKSNESISILKANMQESFILSTIHGKLNDLDIFQSKQNWE
jgi:hypothetical protein